MKYILVFCMAFVFIFALLLGAEAFQVGGPRILRLGVCGAAGGALAYLIGGRVSRRLLRRCEVS